MTFALCTPRDLEARLAAEAGSAEDRRALLAFWASDIHAVENHPSLRCLEDGRVFHVDDILDALKALDRRPARRAAAAPHDLWRPTIEGGSAARP